MAVFIGGALALAPSLLAPWPVEFVDPAPAIARRVDHVLREQGFAAADHGAAPRPGAAIFTSGAQAQGALAGLLRERHLVQRAAPFIG